MTQWRTSLRTVAASIVVATLAACSGSGGSGEPQQGGEIMVAINVEANSLDPALCGIRYYDRCLPVFGSLLRYDFDTKAFVGQMADSFTTDDGKVWTLKLREGLRFSDGQPFDAAAVVFNWDRIKNPATLSPAIQLTKGMTWEVVDPRTVRVTLAQANYQLSWALTRGLSFIGSPTAITAAGAEVGNKPVGAGPFLLENWTRNSQARYVRNPGYFEPGLPHVDALTIKVIPADEQRLNALRSGEINVDWSLLAKDAKAIKEEGFTVAEVPLVGGTGLQFNLKDPVLRDKGLREAMLAAFDSAQINSAVYPGDPAVDAFLRPGSPYRDDAQGTFPAKDLAKAQRLFDDYLARTGKTSETVRFTCYAGIPALEQVAQLVQAQMGKIRGLNFELRPVDAAALAKAQIDRNFQTIMGATLSADMDTLHSVFHTDGPLNVMGYSNPTVDAALERSRSTEDPAVIEQAYRTVNGELSKDGPLRTWRYQTGYLFTASEVTGLVLAGTNSGAAAHWQYASVG